MAVKGKEDWEWKKDLGEIRKKKGQERGERESEIWIRKVKEKLREKDKVRWDTEIKKKEKSREMGSDLSNGNY